MDQLSKQSIEAGAVKLKQKEKKKRSRKLPITTCNKAVTGAILDGEQRYWPESSGDTLGKASVRISESFPIRSSTVERPMLSVDAPTIQLFSLLSIVKVAIKLNDCMIKQLLQPWPVRGCNAKNKLTNSGQLHQSGKSKCLVQNQFHQIDFVSDFIRPLCRLTRATMQNVDLRTKIRNQWNNVLNSICKVQKLCYRHMETVSNL